MNALPQAGGGPPAGSPDGRPRDLASLTLALRPDLAFTPHAADTDPHYVIEDHIHSSFYRVGPAEYTFISLLDGHTPVSEALRLSAEVLGEKALSAADAAAVCQWLVANGLAEIGGASGTSRVTPGPAAGLLAIAARFNPLYIQIPLFHPDRLLSRLVPWFGWIASPVAVLAWLTVTLAASCLLIARGDQLMTASRVLVTSNWLWLALCWIVLKAVHELAHGIVCKRYGGSVREAGVGLLFFVPVAYVDVTSSWRFRSKWQRIFTAAAGMYAELFLAAIAAVVFTQTQPGRINLIAMSVMLTASVTTVLFNANPLMKFDGYHILSDLLELPNLYSGAQSCLRYVLRRYFLGLDAALPSGPIHRRVLIWTYAVASLVWRVVLCAGLIVTSVTLFRGAGIVLSVFAVLTWLVVPLGRFAHYLLRGTATEQPNRRRFLLTSGLVAAVALGLLAAPWPGRYHAPAVVEYFALAVVRTGSAGFVREVLVRDGQLAEPGQVLATLENLQLESELADLVLAVRQAELKARAHQTSGHLAAYQAELKNIESLETKRQEKQSQVDQLSVRAPAGGKVIGRGLDQLTGRYLHAGTELVAIANESDKELQISIAQDDLDSFSSGVGRSVTVRLRGAASFRSPLVKVNPRASRELPHASLAAPEGGPLAVRYKDPDSGKSRVAGKPFELLTPRFTGTVSLGDAAGDQLRAGQRGSVTLRATNESVGTHLFHRLSRWIARSLNRPQPTV